MKMDLSPLVKLTNDALEERRAKWRTTGCTIMTDGGWTDKRRRIILNLIGNSRKETVF